ncbi:MAG TPA: LytTR family DNA-binding domain-containing protein, partial [Candidatus Cybelea sp.]|nr:LytTR family DNA-binding domain-containing protein [Candidatus Cybelea sp.]
VEVLGECADGSSAVRAVEKRQPNLIFLDVQMPRLNGFDVLEAIAPELMPLVIFTTAHDEHAIRAFEVNALDYLLKPFKQARFKAALQRAREQLAARSASGADPRLASLLAGLRSPTGGVPRILVKSSDHILFLKADEIDHIEAAGNYLVLHAGKDRHIVRDTMAAMETRLGAAGFMRISRSAIVNLNRIGQVEPLVAAGEFCVILKNGARLNMTCSLSELQRRMGVA